MYDNDICEACMYYGGHGWCFEWDRFIVKKIIYCSIWKFWTIKEGDGNG